MRHERQSQSLAARIEHAAAPRDVDGGYPREAMQVLVAEGLTAPDAMLASGKRGGMVRLLRLLALVGRGDASVGRLLEGHANAVELLGRLAAPHLRREMFASIENGAICGIWGADPPEDRLRVRRDGDTLHLAGAKMYCSGVDGLDAALVLADAETGGRLLLCVRVDERLTIDRSSWRALGMRASGSYRVSFDGVAVDAEHVVCSGGAYLSDPWFSGGAMRFSAVQAGVARGLAEVVAHHLLGLDRAGAPHQAARLGAMATALVGLEGTLECAGAAWDEGTADGASEASRARAAAWGHLARLAAERALLEIADLAQRAAGLSGLVAPHPLERRLRDALTYVRQPNPDGAREAAGRSFAAGLYPAAEP